MTTRTTFAAALCAALVAGAVLGVAGPASAHDRLVASNPADGSVVTALPDAFSITTNSPMVVPEGSLAFGINVRDAAGRYFGDGCLTFADATMNLGATLGAAGVYTVEWQALSADGHPISSNDFPVSFTWQPPADFVPSSGSATPPVCGEAVEEPSATPEPMMTTQADDPSDSATAIPVAAGLDTSGTLLWLGGGALALVVAIGVVLLLVRPKKAETADAPTESPLE